MVKLPFKVSARAARLIGRENVSNAEGAIIELVKNSYDADANYCVLYIDNRYTDIPAELSNKEYNEFFHLFIGLDSAYSKINEKYYLNENYSKNKELLAFFIGLNSIYIVDNGSGMNLETINNAWMTIGTDNKSLNYISDKGRIKTGAKGIGRFALDRLGSSCEMRTLEKTNKNGYKWNVSWEEFEREDTVIGEVYADISEINQEEFHPKIKEEVFNKIDLSEYDDEQLEGLDFERFKKGTYFKIKGLRDNWNEKSIKNLFAGLDSLIPPKEESVFDIFLFVSKSSRMYGSVQASACEDFDYKVEITVDEEQNVKIIMNRDELDLDQLDQDVFSLPDFNTFPYNKETLLARKFEQLYKIKELVPKYKDYDLSPLKNFSFTFCYLKRDFGSTKDEIFKYRKFNPSKRKNWLDRYGGIKIFRDYFRVRPYGDPKSSAFDWLKLSERVQKSPAGIGKEDGAWRIRPNQISGSIFISREHNVFEDKSSREGLQETELFEIFQEIIIQMINLFEKDRQKIMRSIKKVYDEKSEKESIKNEGKKIAQETVKTQKKKSETKKEESPIQKEKRLDKLEQENLILAKTVLTYDEVVEEKELQLKLIKALAGTGIALTSLSHEIKTISSPLVTRNQHLKSLLNNIANKKDEYEFKDAYKFIDLMIEKDKVLKGWLDVALNIVSKDKRRRKKINIYEVIDKILNTWYPSLSEKKITINLNKLDNMIIEWNAFIIDIESIINNLIINSFIAFQSKEHTGERVININLRANTSIEGGADYLELIFSDTGPGLSSLVKDKNEIFDPFFTTRTEDGTGLGLWIVKTTVQEYKGTVEVLDSVKGFSLLFKFPLRKDEGVKITNV
ncbi:sensor histidine kinase [Neobacillus sp. PS3-40]|uniref:sensor histidine kinase n=1 Tax=Neobacillus sp. PS3-40 TaxID=3070679 RepID=UPI0027E00639|nr:sensor histidine kinase [Neobacillus sp. PS3-40]WML42640.1 sensor histidine kinase [Neobacillus sp. PS3-40]